MEGADTEATLEDLLAEPIVRMLMARDGVAEGELRALIARVAKRRRGGKVAPPDQLGEASRLGGAETQARFPDPICGQANQRRGLRGGLLRHPDS